MCRILQISVFYLVLACVFATPAMLQGQVHNDLNATARSNWRPNRQDTVPKSAAKPLSDESPSLEKLLSIEASQESSTLTNDAVFGAVYLDEHGASKIGLDAQCNNLQCASCQERFGEPEGANAAGVQWPQRSSRFWVRPEYLLWWTQGANVPPLVTTSTAAADAGVLGRATTSTLFGGDELNDDWRSGGRIHAGFWLNSWQGTGIEGNLFGLAEETTNFQASSPTGTPILARPFFNIQTPAEDARLIAFPGFSTGSVAVEGNTELLGGELMLRHMLSPPGRVLTAMLLGYRYSRLDDDLRITESLTQGATTVSLFDLFDTKNTFHGGEIGFISEARHNRWTGEIIVKVALGITQSKVRIDGATTTTVGAGAPVTTVGGLLAQSTNSGTFEQDDFAVIPELGATIGFDITECLKVTVGYTFIYWSRVARAGDQIDRDLNLPLIPGPTTLRPEFSFVMTDYWAQGVNVGLEYSY